MNFKNCKYTHWYDAIIEFRKRNQLRERLERHHILPKSLGGTDDSDNIVALTPREHFVCHKLLVKMTSGCARSKMVFALHKMAHGNNSTKYCVSSRDYEMIRKLNVVAVSQLQKKRFSDPKTRKKQVEYAIIASKVAAKKNRGNPEFKKSCSHRNIRLISENRHNFQGGKTQKEIWKNADYRKKQETYMKEKIARGDHIFQDPQFIETQRQKLKSHWANMPPEERAERCRRISESRRRNKR